MPDSIGVQVANLLKPLTANQQRMIEVIGGAFAENSWRWPIFDYVEGVLENEGIDAWTELETLPRDANSGYAVAWWPMRGSAKLQPDEVLGLTVLGLSRVETVNRTLTGVVPAFFALVRFLSEWRRLRSLSPSVPRDLRISSAEVVRELESRQVPEALLSPVLWRELLEHEPATWLGGGSTAVDGTWERDVSREVYRFQALETVESYVEETVAGFWQPEAPEQLTAPSPFGLVAAIDYLDTVWRLVPAHSDHLFRLRGAQQVASLAFSANTGEEFDSRLSGLGDLLQSIQLPSGARNPRRDRDKPLGPFNAYLETLLPESQARIERAIATLHNVIAVRDSGQHSAAGSRGAAALADLGIGFPPPSWAFAWTVVSARTIEALEALREELATLTE